MLQITAHEAEITPVKTYDAGVKYNGPEKNCRFLLFFSRKYEIMASKWFQIYLEM
jgi:hypothetical protein